MPHTGELAALATASLWAVASLLFEYTSRRVGAMTTNRFRLTLASLVVCAALWAFDGAPFPAWASPAQVGLLALSGLIGLTAGDQCYFRSLVLVGPRPATLLLSLAPVYAAALGWVTLDERLGPRALAGIALSLAGTAWVVLERTEAGGRSGQTLAGALYGLGAGLGQGLGLVLAKHAMAGIDALSMTVVRMTAATAGVWLLTALRRDRAQRLAVVADRRVLAALLAAVVVGPVAGVWLSQVAIRHTETAVAATLIALVPILVIPLVVLVHRERPTLRAVAGALVAVAGVVLLVTRRGAI